MAWEWAKKTGRIVGWPARKLGEQFGAGAVDGAATAVSAKIAPSISTPAPPEKVQPSMFGVNRNTNVAGWAVIVWQILQVIVPILLPDAPKISAETNLQITGLIAGGGLLAAKDKQVSGSGDSARRDS
jgi:hypothetical protein